MTSAGMPSSVMGRLIMAATCYGRCFIERPCRAGVEVVCALRVILL